METLRQAVTRALEEAGQDTRLNLGWIDQFEWNADVQSEVIDAVVAAVERWLGDAGHASA